MCITKMPEILCLESRKMSRHSYKQGFLCLKRTEAADFLRPSFLRIPGDGVAIGGLSSFNFSIPA